MNSSFYVWAVSHIWIAKTFSVLLLVASGLVQGRLGHTDRLAFAGILCLTGLGFLATAYLLQFNFSLAPFTVTMILVPTVLWYAGFDEGKFRKTDSAVVKFLIGVGLMLLIFNIVLGKFN